MIPPTLVCLMEGGGNKNLVKRLSKLNIFGFSLVLPKPEPNKLLGYGQKKFINKGYKIQ